MPRWATGYQQTSGFTTDATLYDSNTATGHSITGSGTVDQTLLLDLGAGASAVKKISSTLRYNDDLAVPLVEYASALAGPWTAPAGAPGAVAGHACVLGNGAWAYTLTTATVARFWRMSTRNVDNDACGTSVVGCQEIEALDAALVHINENPGPTAFTVTPAIVNTYAGVVSDVFTITLDIAATADEYFTVTDPGGTGTLYPTGGSVKVASGATTATFAYLNPAPGSYPLTVADVTSALGNQSVTVVVMAAGGDVDIRLYDSANKRITLPANAVIEAEFEVLERGGYGKGSINFLGAWDDALLTFAGTERVDIRYKGVFAYRGYLKVPERSADPGSGEFAHPTLYGLMQRLDKIICDRKYVYATTQDLSIIATAIINDYVNVTDGATTEYRIASPPLPANLTTSITSIGASILNFDARGMTVAQALSALCDTVPFTAVWGCDVNSATPVPADRIYFRARATTVGYRASVGGELAGWNYSKDTAGIVNKLRVTGGKVSQPNLITDGSFEDPTLTSEYVGNLLTDYSFELNTAWTYTGGAARQNVAPGAAHADSYWLELDTNGEMVEQTIDINYQTVYIFSVWSRLENAAILRDLRLEVDGLTAALALVTTISTILSPTSGTYKRYTMTVDFSANPTVRKAKIRLKSTAGAAANDGVLADEVGFYERDAIANAAWRYLKAGNAVRDYTVWNYVDPFNRWHGAYAVHAKVSAVAVATDYLEIRTDPKARVPIVAGRNYIFLFRYKDVDAVDIIKAAIYEYKSDGTAAATTVSTAASSISAQWNTYVLAFTANANTAEAEVAIRLTGNTDAVLDGAMVIEGVFPAEAYYLISYPDDPYDTTNPYFYSGDQYEATIAANDFQLDDTALTSGAVLSTAANTSVADYGVQEAPVSNSAIVDIVSLLVFAVDYFNAHAIPTQQGTITLLDPPSLVKPDGLVRLLNLPSPPDSLFPSRSHTQIAPGGAVVQTVDLGSEKPDMMDFQRLTEQRARDRFQYGQQLT